jgi:putative transposase
MFSDRRLPERRLTVNLESLCASFLVEYKVYGGLKRSQVFESLIETIQSEWNSATDEDFRWLADALTKEPEKWFAAFLCARVETIPEQTFYRWKKKYTGLEVAQVRQLKQMGEESARLKRVVADLTLDKAMLQDVLRKKF